MQNIVRLLADTILVDLFQKNSKGEKISKDEFDVMIAAYKKDHEQRIDNNIQLTSDQKSKLKNLYNEIADNVKDYCQEFCALKDDWWTKVVSRFRRDF